MVTKSLRVIGELSSAAMAEPASTPATGALVSPAQRAGRDLLLVLLASAATFALAAWFELFERFHRLAVRLEKWEFDELPFVLMVLASGLAWFAWRRWHDTVAALRLHESAEARVGELLAHNRALAQQMIRVQEQERRTLARELHDELGQTCTALRVEAALVARLPGVPGPAVAAAARIGAGAEALQHGVRQMLHRLRPADLDALGLPGALEALAASWQATSGVDCRVTVGEGLAALGDAADVAVFRVAQEALTNVMRHARAHRVDVVLEAGADGAVTLSVRDDGIGMDPQAPRAGLGLLGAQERAAALGGSLTLDSAPGRGLALVLRLPPGVARAEALS